MLTGPDQHTLLQAEGCRILLALLVTESAVLVTVAPCMKPSTVMSWLHAGIPANRTHE